MSYFIVNYTVWWGMVRLQTRSLGSADPATKNNKFVWEGIIRLGLQTLIGVEDPCSWVCKEEK
jgi:hypothetical protein